MKFSSSGRVRDVGGNEHSYSIKCGKFFVQLSVLFIFQELCSMELVNGNHVNVYKIELNTQQGNFPILNLVHNRIPSEYFKRCKMFLECIRIEGSFQCLYKSVFLLVHSVDGNKQSFPLLELIRFKNKLNVVYIVYFYMEVYFKNNIFQNYLLSL